MESIWVLKVFNFLSAKKSSSLPASRVSAGSAGDSGGVGTAIEGMANGTRRVWQRWQGRIMSGLQGTSKKNPPPKKWKKKLTTSNPLQLRTLKWFFFMYSICLIVFSGRKRSIFFVVSDYWGESMMCGFHQLKLPKWKSVSRFCRKKKWGK